MSRKPFYITTPIYYVSDVPHLGHAYTTVVADALARYHRLRGDDTGFLTGTDEHGQKIERMAEERGMSAPAYADKIADAYKSAWKALEITQDSFIRTTDADHEAVVAELWRKLEKQGDIYLSHYEGWYCVPCEQYYTEKELGDGAICPIHKKPVEKVKEESYFFRLSNYRDRLLELYEKNPRFVSPQMRMNEVRAFVQGDLRDLSFSRTTFKWGVPVPDHPGHVVYVWMDALTNYYSATRRRELAGKWDDGVEIVHLIGKEISRFHAVYWPAMLMAAGLRLPDVVFCHGWWTVNGEKMSKTLGNVVNPLELASDLGVDAFRYFVLREIPLGADGDFSHSALIGRYNAELANDLGNLLNRTLGMVGKYFGTTVPATQNDELRADAEKARDEIAREMDALNPSAALSAIWALVRRGNTYVDQSGPWKADKPRQAEILFNTLEMLTFLANLIEPFLPERAAEMRRQLNVPEKAVWPAWRAGHAWTLNPGAPLFPRIDDDRKAELLAKWAPKPATPIASATPTANRKSDKKMTTEAPANDEVTFDEFGKFDFRVAEIVAAEAVPKAKKLLQLKVSLGSETKQVIAGIAERYKPEELIGKKVIFLANLKPATIRGVRSEGMILAAGDEAILGLSAIDQNVPAGTKVR